MFDDEDLLHFLIGSSIFITIYPFVYLSYAYNKLSEEEIKHLRVRLEAIFVALPFLFGILFAITYRLITFIPRVTNGGLYLRFVVAGALTSLFISLIAHYGFNIQTEWLHMENPNASHIVVPVFYFILFYTIGLWIRAMIRYGTAKPPKPQPKMTSPISKPTNLSLSPQKQTSQIGRAHV